MKNKLLLTALMACTVAAWSQTELDDLYFNGKDRQREMDSRPKINRNLLQQEDSNDDRFGDLRSNKSNFSNQGFDGTYQGRNSNPDVDPYSEEAASEDFQYFNQAYAPMSVNHRLSNRYIDPMFPSSGFYNAWNNPYNTWSNPYSSWGFNRFYDPFYSPFGLGFNGFGGGFDPSFGSGCFSCNSTAWGLGFGSSWYSFNYGFNNFGFNNFGWNSPYWGGFGYSSWFRPNTIIINQYDRYPRVVYGKRYSRSSNFNNDAQMNIRNRQNSISGTGSRSNQAGRIASDKSSTYYERGWRGNGSVPSGSNSTSTRSSKNSSWLSAPSQDWSGNPSRNSSGFESGGGRSSGFSGGSFRGSSGGSSSGSRRGRN